MKLVLVRHSKTIQDKIVNSKLWKLSEEGINLITDLSANSLFQDCELIMSSFQTKAIHSALIISQINNIPMYPNNLVAEATSFTSGYFENFEAEVEKWHNGNYRINNGETKEECILRVRNFIEYIGNSEFKKYEKIAIVSHGNFLSCLSELFSTKSSLQYHKLITMPDIAVLDLSTNKFILNWDD